jgi:hypothetical protein
MKLVWLWWQLMKLHTDEHFFHEMTQFHGQSDHVPSLLTRRTKGTVLLLHRNLVCWGRGHDFLVARRRLLGLGPSPVLQLLLLLPRPPVSARAARAPALPRVRPAPPARRGGHAPRARRGGARAEVGCGLGPPEPAAKTS